MFMLTDMAEQVISIMGQENKYQASNSCLPELLAPSNAVLTNQPGFYHGSFA